MSAVWRLEPVDHSRYVAQECAQRRTGFLEAVLLDTMYQVPSLDGVAKVVIDSATIDGESEPLLIYENSEQTSRVAPD